MIAGDILDIQNKESNTVNMQNNIETVNENIESQFFYFANDVHNISEEGITCITNAIKWYDNHDNQFDLILTRDSYAIMKLKHIINTQITNITKISKKFMIIVESITN
ncbi:Hypothetical_protein [Hexamita inflata]|uniref:Hypothetical_protein n=1 Tax=Hexamita inflata TaxID=28002 RepID=A0AA86P6M3_9EUKA|nr:Hypothetical protein HINF_LOCUS20323 [Hexamita inflata]